MSEIIASIQKYNFWFQNKPETGYKRTEYLEKLLRFSGNRLIKVLVGQRRSGKSYVLKQVIQKLIDEGVQPENTLYINKEFIEFDYLTNYKQLAELFATYEATLKPQGRKYIFIDEIQNIDGWEKIINSLSQSVTNEYEIYISGSNSQLLSGELATLLSGRYISLAIYPFSYTEYCDYIKKNISKQSYSEFLQTGGLPELFHLSDNEVKRYYVSAIKDTVLLRDIVQRYNIKDARLLEDIFVFLVNNASNLISINNVVNYFKSKNRKTNYETVSAYISYIEQTYLTHRVERFSIKGKETLSGSCKYYSNDLAYKNYLYAGYAYGTGYLLENAVFLQLRQAGYEVYTGAMRQAEIDFVAIKNDRTIYFQVAYLLTDDATIEREYGAYQYVKDNYEKYVVTLDEIELPSRDGIRHIQGWKLMEILKD